MPRSSSFFSWLGTTGLSGAPLAIASSRAFRGLASDFSGAEEADKEGVGVVGGVEGVGGGVGLEGADDGVGLEGANDGVGLDGVDGVEAGRCGGTMVGEACSWQLVFRSFCFSGLF